MKFKKSFTTNSSSSSFICDVCKDVESGYDAGLSDFDMCECVNGHTFHEYCGMKEYDAKAVLLELINNSILSTQNNRWQTQESKLAAISEHNQEISKIESGKIEDYEKELREYEFRYNVPSSVCPICSFGVITDEDLNNYLVKASNKSKSDILQTIKNTFVDYSAFKAHLKE